MRSERSTPQAAADPARRLEHVYQILSRTYPTFENSDDPWMLNGLSSTPFKSLVSVALSTMTTTTRTIAAAVPLYARVSSFEELAALEDDELRALIKPVAHYNRKTVSLKTMARQILEQHGGRIPDKHEDLMRLQGIGRKCADIMMNFVFSSPSIAVDTHVLRVLNRLGFVQTDSATQAADEINAATPVAYKRHAHEWLIQHGMKVCVARRPRCPACPVLSLCDGARGD